MSGMHRDRNVDSRWCDLFRRADRSGGQKALVKGPQKTDLRPAESTRAATIDIHPMKSSRPIGKNVRIGHVLKVADLERALGFYCGVLGFELTARCGNEAAFVSAGGYHHHIGLNTWESLGGSPPPPRSTGLYHLAILYPTRAELADALERVTRAGVALDGASDHGVSEAIYLRDPDQNGVELYWDRPREEWPRSPDGGLIMITRPLDLDSLLAKAG